MYGLNFLLTPKFLTHTPLNMHLLSSILCVWDTIYLNCDVISLSDMGPRTPMGFWEPRTSDTPGNFLLTYDTYPMYFVYLSHNLRFYGVNRSPEVCWRFVDPPPPPPITTTTTTTTTKVNYILWIRITVFIYSWRFFLRFQIVVCPLCFK